jgi:hypothetical protein
MLPKRYLSSKFSPAPRKEELTYIICAGISENVIQRVLFRDILCSLSNDDGEFDLIVWYVLLHRLGYARNDDVCAWANE